MARQTNRRKFLQETTALGIGLWAAGGIQAKESVSANERIRFACIGVGGKGDSDSADAGGSGDVVAICDIDDNTLENAGSKKFPQAKRYNDYRRLFDEMEKSIDAVTVSTPDHSHACASVMAVVRGKACFTQKPLTHSVFEARFLADTARRMKVATQMGNQGTAGDSLRKAAAIIKGGHLGTIKEVHVWTNRPIWAQGGERPEPEDEVPGHVHWDLFIGPAPFREFAPGAYHPFAWRGWWDFGTGALGDMACHTFNMPFMALNLKNPTTIEAEHSGHTGDSYPQWSVIKFQFPKDGDRPAIPVTWYDGKKLPPKELMGGKEVPASGALVVGTKDTLHAMGDYCGDFELLSGATPPDVSFIKSPGHFQEFVEAIRGGKPAMSNFPDYAGPLTETILLGNLAVSCGKSPNSNGKIVQWDSSKLKATNAPELDAIIKPPYRDGWSLNG
ncbi:MAG: Gfo/Idh/MocA family protein [Planctomycetales bacterium]